VAPAGSTEYTFSNDGVFSHTAGELGQDDTPLRENVNLGELTIDSRAVVGH
jgi:hypothetical protein